MTTAREKAVKRLRILVTVFLCLYYFCASVFIIRIGGRFPYQYLAAAAGVLILLFFIINEKFEWTDWLLTLVFLSFILAAVSAEINKMPLAYRKLSRSSAIMVIPLYLISAYLKSNAEKSVSLWAILRLVLKGITLLQVIWILVQYVMYHVFSIDINQVIFADLLHQEGLVSFYRESFYPAGFTWHGGSIAPLLVLAFVLFRNPIIRLVIVGESFLVGSSTAIVGVFTALFLTVLLGLIRREYRIEKIKAFFCRKNIWKMVLGAVVFAGLVFLFIRMDLWAVFKDRTIYLIYRLKNTEIDASTQIHVQYFTEYPTIFRASTWTEILFGYGNYSSGHPYQILFGQYAWMETFVVECDFINILVSRGIFGFIVYYLLLGITAVKGVKRDSRYLILIVSIMVQGAGYNVQWQYVMMTEVLLYLSLRGKTNFFRAGEDEKVPVPFLEKRKVLSQFIRL